MFLQKKFSWHYFGNLLFFFSHPHHSTILQPNNFIRDWKIKLLGQKMIFLALPFVVQKPLFGPKPRWELTYYVIFFLIIMATCRTTVGALVEKNPLLRSPGYKSPMLAMYGISQIKLRTRHCIVWKSRLSNLWSDRQIGQNEITRGFDGNI
jgi:hypothetical protein